MKCCKIWNNATKFEKEHTKPGYLYYLVLFENRTKPGTLLSETRLRGDSLYSVCVSIIVIRIIMCDNDYETDSIVFKNRLFKRNGKSKFVTLVHRCSADHKSSNVVWLMRWRTFIGHDGQKIWFASNCTNYNIRDHPFKTSACLRGKGCPHMPMVKRSHSTLGSKVPFISILLECRWGQKSWKFADVLDGWSLISMVHC